jgi:hypothetical protein
MTYQIMISEDQRVVLAAGLRAMQHRSAEDDMLLDMLVELPRIEAEQPGNLHGLCH